MAISRIPPPYRELAHRVNDGLELIPFGQKLTDELTNSSPRPGSKTGSAGPRPHKRHRKKSDTFAITTRSLVLEQAEASKTLADVQAAPIDKRPVDNRWIRDTVEVGDVRLRILRPHDTTGAMPAIFYMRSGGSVLENAQTQDGLARKLGKISRLVERLHEGIVSVDRAGRVEFVSSKAKGMLSAVSLEEGRRVPEEWLGFPLRGFAASLFEAHEQVVEARVVSQDGERIYDVTGIPAARSETVLLVVTDVSDRERQRRAEREFVDNAAHELRTPLAAITSAIEHLQAGAGDIPEKRDRFLGHIQHESIRLNRLASSLLVLARAQSREQTPRLAEIPLRELLEDLVSRIEVKPGVELVVDCPPGLIASSNRDLLEHALINLATNAARHTDSGRVCISASPVQNGSMLIEVSDTGSGIHPDEFSRLFDRFYRGPSEDGRAGFGLGLPITKEAVEALGGRIEIASEPGEGTTARILLPADPARGLA